MPLHLDASVLAMLPDNVEVTITVRVADLRLAIEQQTGAGPENVDTGQAAQRFGYSPERWRRWAEAGQLAGAWQDARGGSWHLPLAVCERHIRTLQARGRTAVVRGTPAKSSSRSVPRGPRRSSPRRATGSGERIAGAGDTAASPALSLEAARAARP